ncbi:hypothetical protein ACRQ5Q_29075 [Bradyrhizobium sp. PMVTL-01]|uniref:hypothetical protein n=1 Tax=Bradyrhizobium sp. PMVTL-01 TaxID=3434999 RepID=UPI003F6E4B79
MKRIMRILPFGIAAFVAAMIFNSSGANAVYWRGITAPTNIDVHGWPIIKEPPHPCQWIHVNGYWVRQCLELRGRW